VKLAVAGCSVSDYTKVDIVYGEIAAKEIGAEYLHLAAGGGSNDLAWRQIMQNIRSGDIRKNDIIVWQLTDPARTELPSRAASELLASGKQGFQDFGDNVIGTEMVSRWKIDSWQWQILSDDIALHKAYQNNVIDALGMERTLNYVISLKHVVKNYGIQLCMCWTTMGYPIINYNDRRAEYPVQITDITDFNLAVEWLPYKEWLEPRWYKFRLHDDDSTHFSKAGHVEVGRVLGKHLKKTFKL